MTGEKKLTYTTTFKVCHLNIESPCIQLSESAWIERSNSFVDQPDSFDLSLLASSVSDDLRFGLLKFYQQLLASPIQLRTIHTDEEMESNPFQVHHCSYIAMAATILCDPWFVVGLGSSHNSRDPSNSGLAPSTAFFVGDNSAEPAHISKFDEDELIHIYKFLYRTLALSSWGSDDAKLLLLFLKCVVPTPYQRFTVLNIGLDHLFTEWDAMILNAALFFEYLFTNESRDYKKGIQKWNQMYCPTANVDELLLDIVFKYRHLVAHSNPTKAQRQILDWKTNSGFNDQTASQEIRRAIWSTAKTCLRTIINGENKYREFQNERPN